MDERQSLILDIFAAWALSCHEEYNIRFENPEHKEHIRELTENAKNAFLKRGEYEFFESYETEYYEAIYQYLLHGLHIGEGLYETQRDRIDRFNSKWHSAETIMAQSKQSNGAVESLIDDYGTSKIIFKILDEFGDEIRLLALEDFVEFMSLYKANEHEERFGKKFIFEQAGRHLAENIFRKMTKPTGRPKKRSNLDTRRAYQFGRIVDQINNELGEKNLPKTTISEVSELTFGQKKLTPSHNQKNEIEWALKIYFEVKNSTVRAFLNSISRGKATLSELDRNY